MAKGGEVDDVPYRHFVEERKEFGCVFCCNDGKVRSVILCVKGGEVGGDTLIVE